MCSGIPARGFHHRPHRPQDRAVARLHGIAAAAGKIGAFVGTYALTSLVDGIGLGRSSAIVAGASVLGLLATLTLLPEPRGKSLEDLTEENRGATFPASAVTLGVSESRGTRVS